MVRKRVAKQNGQGKFNYADSILIDLSTGGIDHWMQQMENAWSLKSAEVLLPDSISTIKESKELQTLLGEIVKRRSLVSFRIAGPEKKATNFGLDLSVLISALRGFPESLQDLFILNINLYANPNHDELPEMVTALQQKKNLKTFVLQDSRVIADGEAHVTFLFEAFGAMPNLEAVTLYGPKLSRMAPFQGSSYIANLIAKQAKHLKKLDMKNLAFDKVHAEALAEAIKDSGGETALEMLVLSVVEGGTCGISKVMQEIPHLESLTIQGANAEIIGGFRSILFSLKENLALKSLTIRFLNRPELCELDEIADPIFTETMGSNHTLKNLRIEASGGDSLPLHSGLDFYLKLNRLGRKRLMEEFGRLTTEEWVDYLARAADDPDCLFYLLKMGLVLFPAAIPPLPASPDPQRVGCAGDSVFVVES
jgi:hypothetical protein